MTTEPGGDYANVLLIMGPHSFSGNLGVIGASEPTALEPLRANLTRISAATEQETVDALGCPCDAIVLDPGSAEHFSGRIADAVRLVGVPVIVVRDRQEDELGAMGTRRCVTPAATASVSGGGQAAYESAVEAAAWFAWEARRETHVGDVVPTQRIADSD